jgi:2-polyprenyl-3-methyl-5-hydroxy-6-metoxy-1,4-benzoquinol methylase
MAFRLRRRRRQAIRTKRDCIVIDSSYIQFVAQEKPPWNIRLVDSPADFIPRPLNTVSRSYRARLIKAIDKGEIKLKAVNSCYCGAALKERLSGMDRFGLPFSTYICRQCGLISTSPRIGEESLGPYYDRFYHPLHFGVKSLQERHALFMVGQGHKIFGILLPFIGKRKQISLLEIGAGTGSILMEFEVSARGHGINVNGIGTELSTECVNVAQERGSNVIYGSFDQIIKTKTKFDIIILSHIFEHFINLDEEIAKIRELIHDDSLVYVEVPGVMALHKSGQYNFDYLQYFTHAHMYNFNLTSLTNIFNKNGFRLIYGNEYISAVYTNGQQKVLVENNFLELSNYLKFVESIYTDLQGTKSEIIGKNRLISDFKRSINLLNSRRRLLKYTLKKLLNKDIPIHEIFKIRYS